MDEPNHGTPVVDNHEPCANCQDNADFWTITEIKLCRSRLDGQGFLKFCYRQQSLCIRNPSQSCERKLLFTRILLIDPLHGVFVCSIQVPG
jgi:hypothetical protein